MVSLCSLTTGVNSCDSIVVCVSVLLAELRFATEVGIKVLLTRAVACGFVGWLTARRQVLSRLMFVDRTVV